MATNKAWGNRDNYLKNGLLCGLDSSLSLFL